MRRWLLHILVTVGILALLLVVAVQAVLWSDIPRQQVQATLERQLGLNVQLDALHVGWTGATDGENLRISAPLSDKPLLHAPTFHVQHTALPALLVGRPLKVQALTVDNPTVNLQQDDTGQWNVQRAIEAVQGAQAGKPKDKSAGPIDVPEINITRATVRIDSEAADADQPPVKLQNVRIIGRHGKGLDYTLRVNAGSAGKAGAGKAQAVFSRSQPFAHEVTFTLHPDPALVAAFGLPAKTYALQGDWQGRLANGDLRGELHLEQIKLPDIATVAGRVTVVRHSQSGAVELNLQTINVNPAAKLGQAGASPLTVTGGQVLWQSPLIHITDLSAQALKGDAQLAGTFNPTQRTGHLEAVWNNVRLPDSFAYSGQLTASLERQGPANRRLNVNMPRLAVDSPSGQWRGSANLTAEGRSWQDFTAQLLTEDVTLTRGQSTQTLPDLVGNIDFSSPTVRLAQLKLRNAHAEAHLLAQGNYNTTTGEWSVNTDARHLALPQLPGAFADLFARVDEVHLRATGRGRAGVLHRARISSNGIELSADGDYRPDRATPLQLDVQLAHDPLDTRDAHGVRIAADNITGHLKVEGIFDPLKLHATGQLLGATCVCMNSGWATSRCASGRWRITRRFMRTPMPSNWSADSGMCRRITCGTSARRTSWWTGKMRTLPWPRHWSAQMQTSPAGPMFTWKPRPRRLPKRGVRWWRRWRETLSCAILRTGGCR